MHLLDVVAVVAEESRHAGLADLVQLLARESDFVVAALEEVSIADSRSVELLGEDAEEGWTGQSAGNVRLKGASNGQVDVLVAHVQ